VSDYDLVVIGGGPAGQKAAVQAAKAGARVLLVERAKSAGGACVRYGTIPSKTLRETALSLGKFRKLTAHVMEVEMPSHLQVSSLMERKEEVIAAHERYLARNGYVIRKFFLHVSRAEQKRRFLARIDTPEKNWKFQMGDVRERQHWKAYMSAYEDAIQRTATAEAPWIVVPADHKWFTRLVVSNAIVDALEGLDLRFPTIDETRRAELAQARTQLLAE
jgi:glycine/D-amino acid oxidase-like deaminating enzyme